MSELLEMKPNHNRVKDFLYIIDTDKKIVHATNKCRAFPKGNENVYANPKKVVLYAKEFELCNKCIYEFKTEDRENVLNIFTDGGALKKTNMGLYAYVAYLKLNGHIFIFHDKGKENDSTVNRGEVLGVIKGLLLVPKLKRMIMNLNLEEINIFSDSLYAVNTIIGAYNLSTNLDLFDYCNSIRKDMLKDENIRFHHLKGHKGHYWNELVDRLSHPMKSYYRFALPFTVEKMGNITVIDMNIE